MTTSTTDLIGGPSDSIAQAVNLIAGWLAILAFVIVGGGAIFLLLCLAPALRQPGTAGNALWSKLTRRFALIALAATGIGAIVSLASLLAKANIVTGQSIGRILTSGVLGMMIASAAVGGFATRLTMDQWLARRTPEVTGPLLVGGAASMGMLVGLLIGLGVARRANW